MDVPAVNPQSESISNLETKDFLPRSNTDAAWETVMDVLLESLTPDDLTDCPRRNHVGLLNWKYKPWNEESVVTDSLPHMGCIRLKGAVMPWGGDFTALPSLTDVMQASDGQQKAWDNVIPGCVSLFLHIGTAKPGKTSRKNKNKRKREGNDKSTGECSKLVNFPERPFWRSR
jgi:hypothetical protein